MSITNDIQVSSTVYEFDLYLVSTSTTFEMSIYQAGILYNTAISNANTLTATWVAGDFGPEVTASGQINQTLNTASSFGCIKLAGKLPPGGVGTGAQITTTPARLGRIRLTNSVPFVDGSHAGLHFNFTPSPYNTVVQAYIEGVGTNITANGTFLYSLSDPALPVELYSFASTAQGRTIVLNWSTKTEKNNNKFDIERSLVSTKAWSTIGSVRASGFSNSTKQYSYSDTKLPSGKYQYRLKMVDNDGSFSYSTVEAAEIAIPRDFAVSQNYPNPFNPTTKIDYQVPVDAKVIMEIYNITGQKVFELVNQEQSAGYYTVDFGATKLSSGVYIYRLAAIDKVTGNNFSSIKKMMLLK
jgi:Secretion system C-terminal sorting domain